MATRRQQMSPEQLLRKRERDRAYRARAKKLTPEEKKKAKQKRLKKARDKRYREKKKKQRRAEKKRSKTDRELANERARKYRKKLKKRAQKLPESFLVKEKLWFLYRETLEPALSPCKFRVVISKSGEVRARLTVLKEDANFLDLNELLEDELPYDNLLSTGFMQGFAAFIELTKAGKKIKSPPRASRPGAGGVYRHHAQTWWYDISVDVGQVPRCMGASEQMVKNVVAHSKGALKRDSFGFCYDWTWDHIRPDRGAFGMSR